MSRRSFSRYTTFTPAPMSRCTNRWAASIPIGPSVANSHNFPSVSRTQSNSISAGLRAKASSTSPVITSSTSSVVGLGVGSVVGVGTSVGPTIGRTVGEVVGVGIGVTTVSGTAVFGNSGNSAVVKSVVGAAGVAIAAVSRSVPQPTNATSEQQITSSNQELGMDCILRMRPTLVMGKEDNKKKTMRREQWWKNCWRRGRDSNPREACAPTRFPGVPVRPLRHLSSMAGKPHPQDPDTTRDREP